ncbi:Endonuclease/exonuclease/phosphatase, partial [Cristinia sonorae]
ATLNVKGYGNSDIFHPKNKWNHINTLLTKEKIAILAVQETHMTPERVADVESHLKRRVRIFMSADPDTPTARGGVAVVLNTQKVDTREATATEIVPGRAILVKVKTYKEDWLQILAIYAPNAPAENEQFWDKLDEWFEGNTNNKPDIMLGDFNMVEDASDRMPAHADHPAATLAFEDLKGKLEIYDSWRTTYPDKSPTFTFHQPNYQVKSRLDRIYMKKELIITAREWQTKASGLETDHALVTVKVTTPAAP